MGFLKRWLTQAPATGATAPAIPPTADLPAETTAAAAADRLIDEGNREEDAGRLARAGELYAEAVALAPRHARAHLNVGILRATEGDAAAAAAYEQVLALDEHHAFGNYNFARLCFLNGDLARAEELLRRALQTKPDFEQALALLASVLGAMGRTTLAVDAFEQALKLDDTSVGSWMGLATHLRTLRRFDEADAAVQRALGHDPRNADALRLQSLLQSDQGFAHEALAPLRAAMALEPGRLDLRSDELLLTTCAGDASASERFEKHREAGARFEQAFPVRFEWPAARMDGQRRVRVGYVSGDFSLHPVALFMMPVFEGHDRGAFEVFAYSSGTLSDPITARIAVSCDHWIEAAAMTDGELADRIAADRIDILVDLAGHTGRSRLGVFCARPAPVQVTWLGYLDTTGLTRMDYRLCDARTDPPATAQALHTEELVALPDSQWCYRPFLSQPVAGDVPCERNGHVTFGSFNSALKLTAGMAARWADLLAQVPGSQLRVANVGAPRKQEAIREAMTARGVDADRVTFWPRVPLDRYFDLFDQVDIALDSFPYGGGTTTFDALWMGVPVVTARGDSSASRSAASILQALGLDEWVAPSIDEYVAVAASHAVDFQAIADLRRSLRPSLKASLLTDEARFVRGLESTYRTMLGD